MKGTCCLELGFIFVRRKDSDDVCVFSILTRARVHVGVCMCIHTHTHTAHGVLRCEPKGPDETPGGPEEARWTNSAYMY